MLDAVTAEATAAAMAACTVGAAAVSSCVRALPVGLVTFTKSSTSSPAADSVWLNGGLLGGGGEGAGMTSCTG